jgi:hypothetical protein
MQILRFAQDDNFYGVNEASSSLAAMGSIDFSGGFYA